MADQPTTPLGYMDTSFDLNGYGAVVDYLLEHVPELLWPMSIDTYSRMRLEPQITAILGAYSLAERRARWAVDPAGCRDEVAAQVADDLGLPILGADDEPTGARRRKFKWARHLRLAALMRPFGHSYFEQAYVEADGRWRLDQVQERLPQTVADLHLNPDGTLASVQQKGRRNGEGPKITTADHRLVYYVRDLEGSNYFGRSMLRPMYPLWIIKDQVLRVHATSIRRFGLGIPYAEAPPGALAPQVAEAQRMIATYKASEHSGMALPNGFTAKLAGMTGSVPDALAFITYLDRMMTRATFTSLLDMATAERGNRSLGETVMDLMVYAQQSDAEFLAEEGTGQIVVPLVDANWGEDEAAPRIVVGDVGADLELTAQDIYWLVVNRANIPPEMWAWICQRYGIPYDPEAPAPAPPAPGSAPPA